MSTKLATTVMKISLITNRKNSDLIRTFYNFMRNYL